MSGWFSVKHGITRHPLFKGNPERLAIWIWLIDNAAWDDKQHDIRGQLVMVRRGQVAVSERRIAEEVGVGYQVVRTFLARLKTEQMINAEPTQGRCIITICNYERYQAVKGQANAGDNAELTQHQRTKKQTNNSVPNGTDAAASIDLPSAETLPSPSDPEYWPTRLFREGVQAVRALTGKPDAPTRSLMGKWRKLAKDDCRQVLRVIEDARDFNPADPVAWIEGALRNRGRPADDIMAMAMMRH